MALFLSFVVRITQAALAAAPYILCGVLIAAAMRVLIGSERLRRLLAGDRISAPIKAYLLGLLLPVCSFGAIPIARELARAGVPRNAVLVFLLSAPLFHPLSLVYALTVMDLSLLVLLLCSTLGVFSAASFLIADSAAYTTLPSSVVEPRQTPYGLRRMIAVGVVAAEHLSGPFLLELAVGLVGAGAVGMLLEPSWLGDKFAQDNPWAGAYASILGSAIYMTPEHAIALLDQMFAHGNSFAAALGMLVFGAGVTWGMFLALGRLLGISAATRAVVVVLAGTMVAGTLANSTIYHPSLHAADDHAGHSEAGHTHAFDGFGRPASLTSMSVSWHAASTILAASGKGAAWAIVCSLAALGACGRTFRMTAMRNRLRALLHTSYPSHTSHSSRAASVWSQPLSMRWLVALTGTGLLTLSFMALLVFFPPPADVLDEMRMVRTEVLADLRSGRQEGTLEQLQQWENLAAKLPVGALLRGEASPDRRIIAQELRQSLVALRASITADDDSEVTQLAERSAQLYRQCLDVYSGKSLGEAASEHIAMPVKVQDEAERRLYLSPRGLYTDADIEANDRMTASQKYAGFRAAHDVNPATGSRLCPITGTKANSSCVWIVDGKTYEFCCPPCIDEFVRLAKESPEQIKAPDEYVKQ